MHGNRTLCLITAVLLLLLLLLVSCGAGNTGPSPSFTPGPGSDTAGQVPGTAPGPAPGTEPAETRPAENDTGETLPVRTPDVSYEIPPLETAEFHPDEAHVDGDVMLDVSCLNKGYVAVSAKSDSRLKFQVKFGEKTYNYNISSDGEPSVFPLQHGDGEYKFRVMQNTTESRYIELYSETCDVVMDSEFEPFIRPSDYVPYSKDSQCVSRAAGLAGSAVDPVDYVKKVYEFICYTINYDREKARSVTKNYMSDPDETLYAGRGICFDYAVLAAAMLRSQGIPTKLVFGYVSPGDIYHAWNMFYTRETGWITVSFEVKGEQWTRLDLTFSATGTDSEFVGNGSNYSDVYYY
ncbi:MAG: transglutaminase domain-containing protein [Clostridia bacterium]|nr:transglutaminase domain-containing protein [Clostridia bacterium]